jgi:hypothetical protein
MKKLAFLLFLVACQVSIAYAQACGGSTRTISLKYKAGENQPQKVGYELFYLAPKNTGAEKNDYERLRKFLSKFLYDDPDAEKYTFWGGYDAFVKVPAERAENYLKDYRLEDFKDFYTNRYNEHHLSQIKGSFSSDGTLRLKTRETDATPFIMQIKAGQYETLYLLSSFLGGCFRDNEVQTIEMKRLKK